MYSFPFTFFNVISFVPCNLSSWNIVSFIISYIAFDPLQCLKIGLILDGIKGFISLYVTFFLICFKYCLIALISPLY